MSTPSAVPLRVPRSAWRRIAAALLLIDAKGVYARRSRIEQPGKQETHPHHATPA